ncbi:MAG: hypothetical protein NPIRA03_14240 [Nitrospirales bacterium]|nr:MAG: hypothetical protein NPIRA03_14240 [Nitrospirales bacterium]
MKLIIVFWLSVGVFPALAWAEETTTSHVHLFQTTYPDGSSEEGSVNIAIPKDWMRFNVAPDKLEGKPTSTKPTDSQNDMQIFLDRQEMIYVRHQNKTYNRITKQQMEALKQSSQRMMQKLGVQPGSTQDEGMNNALGHVMKSVREQQRISLEKALDNKELSPEERTRLEHALNTQFSGSSSGISLKVTKTGKTGQQGGIPCEWYTLEVFDVRHMCAAAWDDIPGGKRSRELYHAWIDYMEEWAAGLPFGNGLLEQHKKIEGFPIITITKSQDGSTTFSEQRYLGTKKMTVAFGPPDGYVLESGMSGAPLSDSPERIPTPSEKVDNVCQKINGEIVCSGNADPVNSSGVSSMPGKNLENLPPETHKALEMFKGLFGNQ